MKSASHLVLCILAALFAFEFRVELSDGLRIEFVGSTAHAKGENSGKGNNNDDDGGDNDHDDNDDHDDDDDDHDDEGGDGATSGSKRSKGSKDEDRQSRPQRIEIISGGVRLIYTNGSEELIQNGKYERRNSGGRVVERRPARGSDITHVRALVGRVNFLDRADSTQSTAKATMVTGTGGSIDVLFSNGWREMIDAGRFVLTDQFGRVVVKRRATKDDWARLGKYRK